MIPSVTRTVPRVECLSLLLAVICLVGLSGCAARSGQGPSRLARSASGLTAADATALYRRAGLIAVPGPVAFVGSLGFFAGPHPDSTLSLLTLSMPTRSLTFTRDGDRYRASYTVSADIRRGGSIAHHFDAKEAVRVATFRETSRSEESVIFQEYFDLAPGAYNVSVRVQDDVGSRRGEFEGEIVVPATSTRGISSSIPVHEAQLRSHVDSPPRLVASPRSTAVFGRDTVLTAYVEAYGLAAGTPLRAVVRGERGAILWTDSVVLRQVGPVASGLIRVPVAPLGIGAVELVLWHPGGRDSSRAPLFVSFGDELPVASFDDMLVYLRYFASPARLQALRDTAADKRAEAWVAFLRDTDPDPATAHHEGLQAYFARIQYANQTFREEGVGWLTDRGMVYVTLGEPDEIRINPRGMNQRGQPQVWAYFRHQLELVFVDQTGFNRWRLTPRSELDFNTLVRREQSR